MLTVESHSLGVPYDINEETFVFAVIYSNTHGSFHSIE